MSRNYIRERTIADPKERATFKAERKRAKAKRLKAEQASIAAYLERAKWCANGCGKPVAAGDEDGNGSWIPYCSEGCHGAWLEAVRRKFQATQVRRDARRRHGLL